jgi:hypothetical protein
MEDIKYVLSYIERGSKVDEFRDGSEVTKEQYESIRNSGFFLDKIRNETVFVEKVRLLEVIKEDDIFN